VSSEPTSTSQAVPRDADGRLAGDMACVQCGYNLRGLEPQGRCPECGSPVGESLRQDLLRFAGAEALRRVGRGAAMIVIGTLAHMAAVGLRVTFEWPLRSRITTPMLHLLRGGCALVSLVSGAVVLVGIWWLTGRLRGAEGRRRADGVALATGTVLSLAVLADRAAFLLLPLWQAVAILWPADTAMALIGGCLAMAHVRRLARRGPDETLARQARGVWWGLLVTAGIQLVGIVLVLFGGFREAALGAQIAGIGGLGMVIFGVAAGVLLVRLRRHLRSIADAL